MERECLASCGEHKTLTSAQTAAKISENRRGGERIDEKG